MYNESNMFIENYFMSKPNVNLNNNMNSGFIEKT